MKFMGRPVGRPPTYGKARTNAQLQREYQAQRSYETAQVARTLLGILEAHPAVRPLAMRPDVKRGMKYLLRQDVTGALARFEALTAGPPDLP
jgi:hypothetical protein